MSEHTPARLIAMSHMKGIIRTVYSRRLLTFPAILLLLACSRGGSTPVETATATPAAVPTSTFTPVPPTPIPTPTPVHSPTPTPAPEGFEYYQTILAILGPTGVILPLIDNVETNSYGPTFTTRGAEKATFAWNEQPTGFDTTPGFQGTVPAVTFKGTDEEADSPDADFWSRGDGAADSQFSVGAWVNHSSLEGVQAILSKSDATKADADHEWTFLSDNSGRIELQLRDNSSEGIILARYAAGDALSVSTWAFVVATYSGSGDVGGFSLYKNGLRLQPSTDTAGTYTAMEDTPAPVRLASVQGASAPTGFFNGKIAGGPCGPFFVHKELTNAAVQGVYAYCRILLELPSP